MYLASIPAVSTLALVVRVLNGYQTIPDEFVDRIVPLLGVLAILSSVVIVKREYSLTYLWGFTIVAIGLFFVPLQAIVSIGEPAFVPTTATAQALIAVTVCVFAYITADSLTYQQVLQRLHA